MRFYDDEDDNIPAPRRKKGITISEAVKVEEDPVTLRKDELNRQQDHLRHLVSTSTEKYNNYLNKVKAGQRPSPFVNQPFAKKSLLKHYRRYIYYFVSKIWIDSHPELELALPVMYTEGYERVAKLNEELVTSLKVISSLPKKIVTRAKNRDNMFIVPKLYHNPFLTRFVGVIGDMESSCVVPECLWHNKVRKIIVLEKPPEDDDHVPVEDVDMRPPAIDKEKQIVPLCATHAYFFELIFLLLKMDYNIKKNMETWISSLQKDGKITDGMKTCEDVCNAIPIPPLKALVVHYLSIYMKLFAFGTTDDWKNQISEVGKDADVDEKETKPLPENSDDEDEKMDVEEAAE